MTNEKLILTAKTIEGLPVGRYYDANQPGLVMNVTATSRRWGLYLSIEGRPVKKALGVWPAMQAPAARAAAQVEIGKLRTKAQESPQARRQLPTLNEISEEYERQLRRKKRKDPTWITDQIKLTWDAVKHRRVDSFTRAELEKVHDHVAQTRGVSAAARAIQAMRILLNYAMDEHGLEKNVARRVVVEPTTKRDVFLNAGELEKAKTCIESMGGDARDFFTVVLGTGLRHSNAAGLEWEWIDLEKALLVVPAEKAKSGKEMRLPLAAEVVEVLKARVDVHPRWVFPNMGLNGPTCHGRYWIVELNARLAAAGVEKKITVHDLRRTFGSALMTKGAPPNVVASLMGHSGLGQLHVYCRTDAETAREWL